MFLCQSLKPASTATFSSRWFDLIAPYMRSFNGSHTFLLKSVLSSALFSGNRPFRHFKLVHSLHESKPRKPTQKWGKSTKKRAKSLLTRDSDPKVYMRNIIANIYRILKYSTWDSAQQQLENLPIKWDSYTVNQILKTHPPMERAWLFFNWASRLKGFKHDQYTYTTMLDIFGEAGRISSMNYVFKLMQENGIKVDVVTYTSLMHWISSSGDVDGAVKIWQEMKYNGCNPTVVSYTAYLKILFDNKRVKDASDLYREMIRIGISPTCHTYTVLMEYLVSAGKCEEAMEIFSKMQEAAVQPDKAACNILIQRCCKVGETKTMMRILEYMKENCLVLRYPVFLEALETLRVAGETDALLIEVNPHISLEYVVNEKAVMCIPTSDTDTLDRDLVLILLKKENLIAIDRLLTGTADEHVQLDSVIISMVIEVNCDRCRFDGTLLAFEYSVRRGLNLESYAYLALIGISIRSNTFLKVLEIVKEMIRAGHSLGVYHSALIIYRLGRARRPTLAAKIFDLLPDQQKCTATYTALISVYFSAGSPDKALKIYEIMRRRRIHTALGTYNVLLIGLEKSGKACEIETYRKEKKRLQVDGASRNSVPMDEKICNLLFAG